MLKTLLGTAALVAVIAMAPLAAEAAHKGGKGGHHGGRHGGLHHRGIGLGIVGPVYVGPAIRVCARHWHWSVRLQACIPNRRW